MEKVSSSATSAIQTTSSVAASGANALTALFQQAIEGSASFRESRAFIPTVVVGAVATVAVIAYLARRYLSSKPFSEKLKDALLSNDKDALNAVIKGPEWEEKIGGHFCDFKNKQDQSEKTKLFRQLPDAVAVAAFCKFSNAWIMYYIASDHTRDWKQAIKPTFWAQRDLSDLRHADLNACAALPRVNDESFIAILGAAHLQQIKGFAEKFQQRISQFSNATITNMIQRERPTTISELLQSCDRDWKGVFPQGYWTESTTKIYFRVQTTETLKAFERLSPQDAFAVLATLSPKAPEVNRKTDTISRIYENTLGFSKIPIFLQFLFVSSHQWEKLSPESLQSSDSRAAEVIQDLLKFRQKSLNEKLRQLQELQQVKDFEKQHLFIVQGGINWKETAREGHFITEVGKLDPQESGVFSIRDNDEFTFLEAFKKLSDSLKLSVLTRRNHKDLRTYLKKSGTDWKKIDLQDILTPDFVTSYQSDNKREWEEVLASLSQKNAKECRLFHQKPLNLIRSLSDL